MSTIWVLVENVPGLAYAWPLTKLVVAPQRPLGDTRARLGSPSQGALVDSAIAAVEDAHAVVDAGRGLVEADPPSRRLVDALAGEVAGARLGRLGAERDVRGVAVEALVAACRRRARAAALEVEALAAGDADRRVGGVGVVAERGDHDPGAADQQADGADDAERDPATTHGRDPAGRPVQRARGVADSGARRHQPVPGRRPTVAAAAATARTSAIRKISAAVWMPTAVQSRPKRTEATSFASDGRGDEQAERAADVLLRHQPARGRRQHAVGGGVVGAEHQQREAELDRADLRQHQHV